MQVRQFSCLVQCKVQVSAQWISENAGAGCIIIKKPSETIFSSKMFRLWKSLEDLEVLMLAYHISMGYCTFLQNHLSSLEDFLHAHDNRFNVTFALLTLYLKNLYSRFFFDNGWYHLQWASEDSNWLHSILIFETRNPKK